ncbi:hypothetical protein [Streptosporangium roseum]|uniref:hypothetical protein n=1 Tax=Streptosporangium roseum TaxID=2001 RepID=UPI00332B6FEB
MRAARAGLIALCTVAGAGCLAVAVRAAYLLATEPFNLAVVGYLCVSLAGALSGYWVWDELRPRRRSSEPEPDGTASIGGQRYRQADDV